jgi:hypothetical protein
MTQRLRRCVECPKCLTRYLIGFSPYDNGSYLIARITEFSEDYQLFCSCGAQPFTIRWNWNELKKYAVSSRAYERGYGPPEDVWLCRGQDARL